MFHQQHRVRLRYVIPTYNNKLINYYCSGEGGCAGASSYNIIIMAIDGGGG